MQLYCCCNNDNWLQIIITIIIRLMRGGFFSIRKHVFKAHPHLHGKNDLIGKASSLCVPGNWGLRTRLWSLEAGLEGALEACGSRGTMQSLLQGGSGMAEGRAEERVLRPRSREGGGGGAAGKHTGQPGDHSPVPASSQALPDGGALSL